MRADLDRAVPYESAEFVKSRQLHADLFGRLERLSPGRLAITGEKEVIARVRAGRIVHERSQVFGLGRISRIAGFFREFAPRARTRRLAGVDGAGR